MKAKRKQNKIDMKMMGTFALGTLLAFFFMVKMTKNQNPLRTTASVASVQSMESGGSE